MKKIKALKGSILGVFNLNCSALFKALGSQRGQKMLKDAVRERHREFRGVVIFISNKINQIQCLKFKHIFKNIHYICPHHL